MPENLARWFGVAVVVVCLNTAGFAVDPPAPNQTALGGKGKAVLLFGDSNTEKGNTIAGLEQVLQSQYGYFGSGYRSLAWCPDGSQNNCIANGCEPWSTKTISVSASGDWKGNYGNLTFSNGGDQQPFNWLVRFAPDNALSATTSGGAFMTVHFYGSAIWFYYLVGANGMGSFTVSIDGAVPTTISCVDNTVPFSRYLDACRRKFDGISLGWHDAVLSTAGNGLVAPLGVETRTVTSGPVAVAHKWGRSASASFHHISTRSHIHSQMAALIQPDYFVTMIGTNDADFFPAQVGAVMTNTGEVAWRVRSGYPSVKTIVLSTLAYQNIVNLGVLRTDGAGGRIGQMKTMWGDLATGFGAVYGDLNSEMLRPWYSGGLPAIGYDDEHNYRWWTYTYNGDLNGSDPNSYPPGYVIVPSIYPTQGDPEKIHFSPSGGLSFGQWLVPLLNQSATAPTLTTRGAIQAENLAPVESDIYTWLAADGPVTLDSTNGVRLWGNAFETTDDRYDASQDCASYRPLWVANAANGRPAIRFSSASKQFMGFHFRSAIGAVAMVWKPGTASSKGPILAEHLVTNGPTPYGENGDEGWSTTNLINGWRISTSAQTLCDLALLGATWHDDGTSSFLDGDIAEIIVRLNGDFGTSDMTALKNYWTTKYGSLATRLARPLQKLVQIRPSVRLYTLDGRSAGLVQGNSKTITASKAQCGTGVYLVVDNKEKQPLKRVLVSP